MAKRKRKGAFVKKSAPKKSAPKKKEEAPAKKKVYPEITLRTFKMNVTKALNKDTPSERRNAMADILMRAVQGNIPEFAEEAERLKEIK